MTHYIRYVCQMRFTISIIIPVYHGGKIFEQCLRSAVAAVRPGDEIIVVADGESDGAWRIAPDFGAKVVNLEKNGGPGRARNRGVEAAVNEIVFFVDADVTIRPDALDVIDSIFNEDPKLSALFGSYDEFPSQPNFVSQFKNLLHHYVHQRNHTKASTFWGACGAIRRNVFLSIGGFSERYTEASIEDIELGYRLTDAGHAIRLVKHLQVTHHKQWTASSLVNTDIFRRGRPWTYLLWRQLWRNGKVEADLNLDWSHRASLLTSGAILISIIAGCFQPPLLLALLPLIACFLLLNRSVLRFFCAKRGLRFAAAAAFWRFAYDLYSWVGFFLGSSDSARVVLRRLNQFTFSKIDPVALGVAVGAVTGAGLFVASVILLLKGGDHIGPTLALMGQFFPGYRVTWSGALIGLVEGFAVGYAGGWFFATVRNLAVRIAMSAQKAKRATFRLIKSRSARPLADSPARH